MLKYFDENYIQKDGYPKESWNVCGEEHRTNNISESFNRELNHYCKQSNYFNGTINTSVLLFEGTLF